jgi:methylated-DNA-[protein]-cysteine S-methyltransferase
MAKLDYGTEKRHVYKKVDSPIGRLMLVATDEGLAGILWENDRPRRVRLNIEAEDKRHPVLIETERQLKEYFAGQRQEFALKLDLAGTAFQHKVWNALLTIPFGETRSYGQIANQIGHPRAVRAVGAANGRNPVSIVTPCHRVIGATGKLTGFAGGLDVKAHLLAFEGATGGVSQELPFDRSSHRLPKLLAASALLTTETLVSEISAKKKGAPTPHGAGMDDY